MLTPQPMQHTGSYIEDQAQSQLRQQTPPQFHINSRPSPVLDIHILVSPSRRASHLGSANALSQHTNDVQARQSSRPSPGCKSTSTSSAQPLGKDNSQSQDVYIIWSMFSSRSPSNDG